MKVSYYLDPKTAVLAGSNDFGTVVAEIDPALLSQEQREELVRCAFEEGAFVLDHYSEHVPGVVWPPFEGEKDSYVLEVLSARVAARNELAVQRKQKNEELVSAFLATPDDQCEYHFHDEQYLTCTFGSHYECLPMGNPLIEEKLLRVKAVTDEKWRLQLEAKQKQQEQEEEQIEAWFAQNGTENQRRRRELGLLPQNEILDCMRDEAFQLLNSIPRFKQLNKQDLSECRCSKPIPSFWVKKGTEATADQFEMLERISATIKAGYPDAEVSFVQHRGHCQGCKRGDTDNEMGRAAKVSIKFGNFLFTREYQLDPNWRAGHCNHRG